VGHHSVVSAGHYIAQVIDCTRVSMEEAGKLEWAIPPCYS
jgi:hypothetical protein